MGNKLYTYTCPVCFKMYERIDDLMTHQKAAHNSGASYIDARDPMQRLESRIASLEEQVRRLTLEIEALNTDPDHVVLNFPSKH